MQLGKKHLITIVATIILIFALIFWFNLQSEIYTDEDGQKMLAKELVVFSEKDLKIVQEEFGGVVTVEIPETETYQVRFPVSNYDELMEIQRQLQERGIKVSRVFLTDPLE